MLVCFDEKGSLKEQLDSYGGTPVVGSDDFTIFVYFQNTDYDLYDAPVLTLKKPHLSEVESSVLFGVLKTDFVFEQDETTGHSRFFEQGKTYPCYVFDFTDFGETMLDKSGLWHANVTLIDSDTQIRMVSDAVSFVVTGDDSEDEDDLVEEYEDEEEDEEEEEPEQC